jgi:hypothetical protein
MTSIESLPHKLLRRIFEYCSNEELFNIMSVSVLWKAAASQVVAHSFRSHYLVMWIDQEGWLSVSLLPQPKNFHVCLLKHVAVRCLCVQATECATQYGLLTRITP